MPDLVLPWSSHLKLQKTFFAHDSLWHWSSTPSFSRSSFLIPVLLTFFPLQATATSIHPFVSPSVHPFIYPSIHYSPIHLPTDIAIHPSVYPSGWPDNGWPDKMVLDKMVRTKCHGQNVSNLYRFKFNSIEFIFSNHKSQISNKPKWV